MKKYLILLVVLLASYSVKAQCPPNIDFEGNTLNGWICKTGSWLFATPGGGPTAPNPQTIGIVPTRHAITTMPAYDVNIGGTLLPVVSPLGGLHSLKIGNDLSGYETESAEYHFTSPNVTNYYLTYLYACVLETATCDASHWGTGIPNDKTPVFFIRCYDSTTNQLVHCDSLVFSPCSALNTPNIGQGFISLTASGITWKPWSAGIISLRNRQGHRMILSVLTADCNNGGHYGYGYFDVQSSCSNTALLTGYCPGSSFATLYAPPGFQSYTWYDSTTTTVLGTGIIDTLYIPSNAPDSFKVKLVLQPFNGLGCLDTLTTMIRIQPRPVAAYWSPGHYCVGSYFNFIDSSYSIQPGTYINSWNWDFGDPNSTVGNLDTSILQNPTHQYTALGTYTCRLIVTSNVSCVSDTVYHQIYIDKYKVDLQLQSSRDTMCAPYDTTTLYSNRSFTVGSSYIWDLGGGTLVSGSLNTAGPLNVKWGSVGWKKVKLTYIPAPGVDSLCWNQDSVSLYIRGFEPPLFLDGVDSICLHDVTTINLSSKPSNCGVSNNPCTSPLAFNTIGSNNGTTFNTPTVFNGFYTEARVQMLFTASELLAAGFNGGAISEVSWEILVKNSTQPYQGFSIKMACVPYTSLVSGVIDTTTPLTLVYTNSSYTTFVGINNFVLSTKYDWDGVSSLLVDVCFDNGTSNFTQDDRVKKTTTIGNFCNWARSDSNPLTGCDKNYPGTFFTTSSTERPDITFKGCNAVLVPSVVITWGANPGPFAPVVLTGNSASVAPLVNTDYTVNASDNGCTNTQYFHVEQMTKNFIHASKDTSICKGATVALTVTGTGPAPAVPVPCSLNTTGGCTGTPITAPVIGTGTQSTTYTPFDYANSNEHYLMRYTASSVLAAFGNVAGPKTITQLDLNVLQKNTSFAIPNLTIRMQCVPTNYVFPTTSYPSGGLVVRSPSNYNTIVGWNNFTLTSPYNWDGVSDLLVEFCFNGGFDATDSVQGTTMAGNCVLYGVNSGTLPGCNITAANAVSNSLPNIRFHYCNVSVNPSVLNYHWTSLHNSIPAGVNVDNDTIQMQVNATDTFVVYLLGTSTNPFCPVKDTVVITVANALSTNPSHDTVVCKGSMVSLSNQLLTPGMTVDSIKWSTDYGNNTLLTCKKCNTTTDSSYVSHHVYSTVITNLGCTQTDTIFIRNPILPKDSFSVINPVCLNSPSTLTYIGNGTNAYTYDWNLDVGSNPASGVLGQGPLAVSWNIAGPKQIKLTIDTIGCKVSYTDSVYVIPVLDATFTLSKHAICAGDSVQMLYAGTSNAIAGTLFTPSANGSTGTHGNNIAISPITYTYATAGKYYLNLTVEYAGHLCPITYVDSIEVYSIPSSNFTVNKTDICSGDNVLVTFTGKTTTSGAAAQYAWNYANPSNIANGTVAANMDTTLTYTNVSSTMAVKNITLTVTQNGCVSTTSTHSVNVHVIPVATIDVIEQVTCSGLNVTTTSTYSVVENVANANYIWTSTPLPTIPSSTTFSGLGQNGPFPLSFSNDTNLVKDYMMLQIIENGCTSNVAIDSVDVLPNPISSFRVIPDKICSGQTATFIFNGVIDTSCTNCPATYNWSFQNGVPSTGTGTTVKVTFNNADDFTEARNGSLDVTQQTCTSNKYTAPVMVHPLPKIDITGPVDICDKTTSYLSTSVNYVKYLWSDGSTNDTINITHGGDYSVTVTDVNKCVSQALTHITIHPIPVANAGEDQLIFVGNSAFLNASRSFGGDAYLWTPNRSIDAPTIVSPVVSPTETTPYILTYYNSAVGCTDYDTVIIKVRDCEPLVLPNAFTPNGDNIDDYFMVLNPNDYYRLVRLEIYNRWGELVYATNDKNNKGWDGQYRGVNQEVGTYIYHVTAECGGGKLMNVKGDVTLLR